MRKASRTSWLGVPHKCIHGCSCEKCTCKRARSEKRRLNVPVTGETLDPVTHTSVQEELAFAHTSKHVRAFRARIDDCNMFTDFASRFDSLLHTQAFTFILCAPCSFSAHCTFTVFQWTVDLES